MENICFLYRFFRNTTIIKLVREHCFLPIGGAIATGAAGAPLSSRTYHMCLSSCLHPYAFTRGLTDLPDHYAFDLDV